MIASAHSLNMRGQASPVVRAETVSSQRRGRDWTHLLDQLRAAGTDLVRDVVPEQGLKRYRTLGRWFSYNGLSRMRRGINCPLGRLVTLFAALRALGLSRHGADQLVAWLESVIDELWADAAEDLRALSLREQASDVAEDLAQQRVDQGDLSALSDWIRELNSNIAAKRSCRAAALQYLHSTARH